MLIKTLRRHWTGWFVLVLIGAILLVVASKPKNTTTDDSRSHNSSPPVDHYIDLARQPLRRLEPGIVIDQLDDTGYSDLVTLVLPRLSSGHVDDLPDFSQQYAGMFNFTVLADVVEKQKEDRRVYLLEKVGIGFAMNIDGNLTIVNSDDANQHGAKLGVLDRSVLRINEDCLDEIIQIARTEGLILFDAKSNMLIQDVHQQRIIRHFLWVSPVNGELAFLVWMIDEDDSGDQQVASHSMQLLPPGYHEDRKIHVSEGGFFSQFPTAERFALETIPQGTSIIFPDAVKKIAGKKTMTESDLKLLVDVAADALATNQNAKVHPND